MSQRALGARLPEKIGGNLLLPFTEDKGLVTRRKYFLREADNFHHLWSATFSLVFSLDRCSCKKYIHTLAVS